jgi:hypothetical protein
MTVLAQAAFLIVLVTALKLVPLQEQKLDYNQQAELDAQGNIYVSSDEGKLIKMDDGRHCSEVMEAADRQTIGCRVMQDQRLGNTVPTLQLEIYRKGGHKSTIEPGAPIREWHFWKDGDQVAVYSGPRDRPGVYQLYDSATARLIDKQTEPSNESLLPQWAKSRAEIQDESVPMSSTLNEERTKWIAKVLRQIGTIKPGMRRKDLLAMFRTEGGLSFRTQQTFVSIECPYIKVDVQFKVATDSGQSGPNEGQNDIIKSVSRPYLAWNLTD